MSDAACYGNDMTFIFKCGIDGKWKATLKPQFSKAQELFGEAHHWNVNRKSGLSTDMRYEPRTATALPEEF